LQNPGYVSFHLYVTEVSDPVPSTDNAVTATGMSSDESDQQESSGTDDYSDTDLATVLTQLIRRLIAPPLELLQWCFDIFIIGGYFFFASRSDSGRAHILSERNLGLEERSESFSEFYNGTQPPPPDVKPDLTTLKV